MATVTTLDASERAAERVKEWEAFGAQGGDGGGLFDWETDFYRRFIPERSRILLVGGGAGRDVFPLVEWGHDVTVLDIAPEALKSLEQSARTRSVAVKTMCGAIETATLAAESYDAVVFSWYTYSLVASRRERLRALSVAADAIQPNGRILISYPADAASAPLAQRDRLVRFGARLAGLFGTPAPEAGDSFSLSGRPGALHVSRARTFSPSDVASEIEDATAGLTIHFHEMPRSLGQSTGLCVLLRSSNA